jgi:uncharacterized membrane protein YphA (DoxX/SURF4 family)
VVTVPERSLVHSRSIAMWRNGLRCVLGVLILATGVGKLLDVPGFVDVVETYRLGLSDAQAWTSAILVICIEIGIGVWLLSGLMLRSAAIAAAALNMGWFAMLSSALWRGLQLENCGCFGVFFARPLRWYSPLEDLVIVAACLLLARLAQPSVRATARRDSPWTQTSSK